MKNKAKNAKTDILKTILLLILFLYEVTIRDINELKGENNKRG